MLNRTSGGSSDTELNELTVAPIRIPPSVTAVTTAMPVAKQPSASRNSCGENDGDVPTLCRIRSVPRTGKIPRQLATRHADRARGRRRVAAAADEPRLPGGDHGADGGDVAVPDRGKCIVLGAAIGRVDKRDVRCLPRGEQSR